MSLDGLRWMMIFHCNGVCNRVAHELGHMFVNIFLRRCGSREHRILLAIQWLTMVVQYISQPFLPKKDWCPVAFFFSSETTLVLLNSRQWQHTKIWELEGSWQLSRVCNYTNCVCQWCEYLIYKLITWITLGHLLLLIILHYFLVRKGYFEIYHLCKVSVLPLFIFTLENAAPCNKYHMSIINSYRLRM
jgi:hypothetical protein